VWEKSKGAMGEKTKYRGKKREKKKETSNLIERKETKRK